MSAFKKKLWAVFDKAGGIGSEGNHRYVPRAIDGGPDWRVFDRKHDRFLTDREVRHTPLENLSSEPLEAS